MCFVIKTKFYNALCPMSECYVICAEDELSVFDRHTAESVLTISLSEVVGVSLEPLSFEEVL